MKSPTHKKTKSTANNPPENYVSIDAVPKVDRAAPSIRTASNTLHFALHPSIWFALSIMSVIGIISVLLHYLLNGELQASERPNRVPNTLVSSVANDTNNISLSTPKTEEKDEQITAASSEQKSFSSNIDQIANNCARLVTSQNSFAVFEHGTCVLLIEPLEDPVVSARSTLKILSDPNIKFEVKPLNNNNYLIIFDKYLFCWLFADELAKNKDAIMRDKRLGRTAQDPPALRKLPEIQLRVGKLARLCLIADSKKLNIKKIIRAKQTPAKSKQAKQPSADKK